MQVAKASSLPTGTVTLLFTDIEGSTQHWERQRATMPEALRRHDELVRSAIEAHGGYVFKTVGDQFCAAFSRASDALAAAADAQRSLASEDWTAIGGLAVRMALHSGATEERDGDYFGPAVNRVARLISVSRGGQILTSGVTRDLAHDSLPDGTALVDLGLQRLQDLAEQEHVWQVDVAGLPRDFPPLRSLDTSPNNLPIQRTTFVGRDGDVGEVKELLEHYHLLTVVGSGGAGKTRAAIQIGTELLDSFADGVWFVELAPVSDGSLVPATVARTLGVRESTNDPLIDTLLKYLRLRRSLLILDNCEHVVDDARSIADSILRVCPEVRILATSRESLSIGGERVFRLPSLAVPPANEMTTARTASSYGAITLFADRALAADGRFSITDENAPFVAEICRRLDGIPLAIELAAARITVLSPQQLAKKLDERFRVLTGGDRSALPRHQTMRALIDWSYDLLSEEERALFRDVSIFAGGFTLAGATAVCSDERCDEIAVLDLIASLVDKSLMQTGPGDDDRYRLLESTRQYARERLVESGELENCSQRHLSYLSERFRQAADEYESTMSGAAVMRLAPELEDVRSALDWALRRKAVNAAADLFLATRLWIHLGLHREAIERANHLLTLVDGADSARIALLWERVAVCAAEFGHAAVAKEAVEHAVRCARISGDPGILADCLLRFAYIMGRALCFDEALAAFDEAEALDAPSFRRDVQALHARGVVAKIGGNLDGAARCDAQVRELYASVGNELGVVSATQNLAELEHARGATAEAIEIAKDGLTRAEQLPDRSLWAHLMGNLAGYLCAVDDLPGARRAAREAINFFSATDPGGPMAAAALEHLALCYAIEGEFHMAATLEGYADKTLRELGLEREHTERTSHDRLRELLARNLSEGELDESLRRGERMQAPEILTGVGSATQ